MYLVIDCSNYLLREDRLAFFNVLAIPFTNADAIVKTVWMAHVMS